jgi:hypothetical protein
LELGNKSITKLNNGHDEEDWRLWLVDTGQETLNWRTFKETSSLLFELFIVSSISPFFIHKPNRPAIVSGKILKINALIGIDK